MIRKIIFKSLAVFLSVIFLIGGGYLLSPSFDGLLNKINGITFVLISIAFIIYAINFKIKS